MLIGNSNKTSQHDIVSINILKMAIQREILDSLNPIVS